MSMQAKLKEIAEKAEPGKEVIISSEVTRMIAREVYKGCGKEIQELERWRAESYAKAAFSTVKYF